MHTPQSQPSSHSVQAELGGESPRKASGRNQQMARQWCLVKALVFATHGHSIESLAVYARVSTRTIRRDLELLADVLPLRRVPGYPTPRYRLHSTDVITALTGGVR